MNTAHARIVPESRGIYSDSARQAQPPRPAPATAQTREAGYAAAARKMRLGKLLVIAGFVLLLLGAVAYCVAGISAGAQDEALHESPWVLFVAQGTLALGTLMWLAGSFLYFLGGLDSDPDGPDLYF
ncbi:MAG: hypothetical protein IT368_16680 [Candidatus Hydrogenedentes bacterium]|nr:hypothetical protein [Candidatus Hydrogenedentota bacterium]